MKKVNFLTPSYNYRGFLKRDIKEVAQEFEAMLLRQVLKEAFRTTLRRKDFFQRMYYDMFLENLSLQLAKAGGVGIADFILENYRESITTEKVRGAYNTFSSSEEKRKLYEFVKTMVKRENLPEWITRIPEAESNYNPFAVSKKGAAGLWQLMPETARELGLKVGNSVDERFDPVKSTKAALRFIKKLYEELKDWRLVLIAYNWGIGNLDKVGRERVLKEPELLPRETRNYIKKILGSLS